MIPNQNQASLGSNTAPPRIVLDTNLCLDLFVFRDPRWQLLLLALQSGKIQAITRADCRMEWQLVLAYRRFGLDNSAQQSAMTEFDQLICLTELTTSIPAAHEPPLPVCRDSDDQKFMELALESGATWLLTKDKALLKLARKTQKQGRFQILSPEQWISAYGAAS